MKHANFMSAVKGYYGSYENEFVESVVLKHILSYAEDILDEVYVKLISTVPRKENQNPVDVARLQSLFKKSDKATDAEALKWWDELNRKSNSWRNCIISDIRAQSAIETMGGWIWFCQRIKMDEQGKDLDQWHRKQFIELFKMYTENPPEKSARILDGLGETVKPPVMIGDADQCLMIQQSSTGQTMQAIENMTKEMRITQ